MKRAFRDRRMEHLVHGRARDGKEFGVTRDVAGLGRMAVVIQLYIALLWK